MLLRASDVRFRLVFESRVSITACSMPAGLFSGSKSAGPAPGGLLHRIGELMSNLMVKPESSRLDVRVSRRVHVDRARGARRPGRGRALLEEQRRVVADDCDRMRDLERLGHDDRGIRGQIDRVVFRAGRSQAAPEAGPRSSGARRAAVDCSSALARADGFQSPPDEARGVHVRCPGTAARSIIVGEVEPLAGASSRAGGK